MTENFLETMAKSFILTVVRHGETAANKERVVHGQTDTKLNEIGEKQATLAGKALKSTKFHKVYSSDLQRAKKTCQLIVEQNKVSEIKDIIHDSRIREKHFGIFEDKPFSEYANKVKEAGIERWMAYIPENGESLEQVRERVRKFFYDLIEQVSKMENETPSILMVTHGGVIQEFFQILFDEMDCKLSIRGQPVDFMKSGAIQNTCWSRFEIALCDNKIESIKCTELCNADHLNELD